MTGRVWVAGSINMDVVARTPRVPAPGETIIGSSLAFFPGGKGANQAVAAANAGADTRMVGVLGRDVFGETLHSFLSSQGVDVADVGSSSEAATGTALIAVSDDGENSIVVVPGTNALLTAKDVEELPIQAGDVCVSQFEIANETTRAFLHAARARSATAILNPAPAREFAYMHVPDVLVVNETELGLLAGHEDQEAAARSLFRRKGQTVVLTLGARGCIAVTEDGATNLPGRKVKAVDTTGAGDCFVGSLAARLALGEPLPSALEYANIAASICVTRAGAGPSMPGADEVGNEIGVERQL